MSKATERTGGADDGDAVNVRVNADGQKQAAQVTTAETDRQGKDELCGLPIRCTVL